MAFAYSYDRKPVRVVGPFDTDEAANAHAKQNALQAWESSVPTPCPSADMLSWQVWQVDKSVVAMVELHKQIVAIEKEKDERVAA